MEILVFCILVPFSRGPINLLIRRYSTTTCCVLCARSHLPAADSDGARPPTTSIPRPGPSQLCPMPTYIQATTVPSTMTDAGFRGDCFERRSVGSGEGFSVHHLGCRRLSQAID